MTIYCFIIGSCMLYFLCYFDACSYLSVLIKVISCGWPLSHELFSFPNLEDTFCCLSVIFICQPLFVCHVHLSAFLSILWLCTQTQNSSRQLAHGQGWCLTDGLNVTWLTVFCFQSQDFEGLIWKQIFNTSQHCAKHV